MGGLERDGRSALKKTSSSSSSCQKAIRVRFYRNGDRYFTGFVFPIAYSRYREFDMLLRDLSDSSFCDTTVLPCGVRYIFGVDGVRIKNVHQMEEGGAYVCSSANAYIALDYVNGTLDPKWKTTKRFVDDVVPLAPFKGQRRYRSKSCTAHQQGHSLACPPGYLGGHQGTRTAARIMTVIRNGTGRPRQMFQWLLNRRTAPTFGRVLDELSFLLKLDSGSVKHLFNSEGKEILTVEEMFQEDAVLIAFGSDVIDKSDIFLSSQELNMVEKIKRPAGKQSGEGKDEYADARSELVDKSPAGPWPNAANLEPNGLLKLTERYLIGNEIGVGNFAVVKECKDRKRDLRMALKVIDRSKCEKNKEKMVTEIAILRRLKHANVVGLVGKYDTSDFIYLIMELCQDGNLVNFLLKNKCYSEQDVSGMVHNIASGIQYLHVNSIIHRDIKFENILIQKDASGLTRLRVCDFGLACQNESPPLYVVCGTPHYMAPEILLQTGYDCKIDVWSLGVMFYVLLVGSPPFSSNTNDFNEVFELILRGDYDALPDDPWSNISDEAKDLMDHMLERESKDRFSAKQVLNCPWVAEDNIAKSVNLWPLVEDRIVPFLTVCSEYSKSRPHNFLAKTALDKESNYFETEEEQK